MRFVDSRNNEYTPHHWLTFNDVLLKPQRSKFKSRNDSEISLTSFLGDGLSFDLPIISANMDTVTGKNMATAMHRLGGLGILHRFYPTLENYTKEIESIYQTCSQVAFSVGCGERWVNFVTDLYSDNKPTIEKPMIVCLDVAHGHMEQSLETVAELRKIREIFIVAGNVATEEGAVDLANAGANVIKVGVGPGSLCTTRMVTGHGVPQLSAIISARVALNENGYHSVGIIADGGIRNSGDIVKAIAAGADAVMLGHILSGCDETPGEIFNTVDGPVKMYRGQSSKHFLKDMGKMGVAAEGEHLGVKAKGPVADIINELVGGIRSGLTYSGVGDLYTLQEKATFMEISDHAWTESTPHALNRS